MKRLLPISIIIMFLFVSNSMSQDEPDEKHPNVHKIEIKEVIQTTSYTYLFVQDDIDSLWMAIPKMEAKAGEIYYYHGGMEMRDFKSKELNRTFESILFLNGLVDPDIVEGKKDAVDLREIPVEMKEEPETVNIQAPEGGISISELLKNKKKYEGKNVRIRGKVIKYNTGIMSKNWIHLDDGSCDTGKCDLTATTGDETKIGDVITIEGTITLNKDFGAGYFYSLIMEDAKILP